VSTRKGRATDAAALPSRRLYLLRHAKSSWADPGLGDHERPLARRGEEAAGRMGRYLQRAGAAPELVLCSSAVRTVATLDGIRGALPDFVAVRVEDGLYGASAERLLERLGEIDDDVMRVMLVGHNPGMEDLANELVGAGEESARTRMAEKFPTGALAVLSFDGGWPDLTPGAARLDAFVVPRDLA
jgi:phosphohistidine phosphatase